MTPRLILALFVMATVLGSYLLYLIDRWQHGRERQAEAEWKRLIASHTMAAHNFTDADHVRTTDEEYAYWSHGQRLS